MMSSTFFLGRLSSVLQRIRLVKNVMFSKYIFFTNMGISVVLSGIGDVLQQHYMIANGHRKSWDSRRTHHMAITGLSVGFVCHHWYMFLDKRLPGRTVKVVFKKVLIDQLFFSPLYITVFFLTAGLLEKSSLNEISSEIIKKGKLLYVAEWTIWPPAQLINFFFLPTRYRILYDSTISLGYDIYTSYVKNEVGEEDSLNEEKVIVTQV